jgi:hypothetical protein
VSAAASTQAQQVTIQTPYRNMQDSFFENSSINWSGNYRGVTFSYGGGALALPPFGSPNLSAGLSTNFAILNKYGQINFNTNFSQGYQQSAVTQTPSVTIMNGQTGYVSDSTLTPFVMGAIPVVGSFPVGPQQLPQFSGINPGAIDPRIQAMMQAQADSQAHAAGQGQAGGPVPPQPNDAPPRQDMRLNLAPDPVPAPEDPGAAAQERLNGAQESTAGRPALSVAEAKRLHQQEQAAANGELAALMERARALEDDGKPNVAKIYYQQVARRATGDLQQQARTRLYELQGSGK